MHIPSPPPPPIPIPDSIDHQTPIYRSIDGHDLRVHLYRPRTAPATKPGPSDPVAPSPATDAIASTITAPRPAILWFHGGGWVGGHPGVLQRYCVTDSLAGLVALAPQYRLVGKQARSGWDCMDDAYAAYRWTLDHADELGIDTARVILAGGSAGGHLAATVLTHHPDSRAAAMILLNPVLDCTDRGYTMHDRGHDASPIHRIRPGLPPTLIFHGDADATVPYENSVRFQRLMTAAGNLCRLITLPGEGHGLPGRLPHRIIPECHDFLHTLSLLPHLTSAP